MAEKREQKLHESICHYLKFQYPNVVFISEQSGLRVSPGISKKLKATRSVDTHADLYILKPIGKYSGLILEIKAVDIYYKGSRVLKKNEHVEDQAKTIEKLNKLGYYATFVVGLDEAIEIIDDYLNGNI